MASSVVWPAIESGRVAESLEEVLAKLDGAAGEVALDFSAVPRLDPKALRVMEQLAVRAELRSVTVLLRGVNVDVYKVLKLMKLAPRFTFAN